MIDAFFAWLPGNDVMDWLFLIGTALLVALLGWSLIVGAGLFRDWLRMRKPVQPLAVSTPAPVVSEPAPAVRKRSPFAGKRVAK